MKQVETMFKVLLKAYRMSDKYVKDHCLVQLGYWVHGSPYIVWVLLKQMSTSVSFIVKLGMSQGRKKRGATAVAVHKTDTAFF